MPSPGGTSLVKYALMVRQRWLLVLVVVLSMAGPAYWVSTLESPSYRSEAQILLVRQELDENFNPNTAPLTDTQINNEIAYITSDEVARRARGKGALEDADAGGRAGSNVLSIISDSSDPYRAAATVQAYLDAYADSKIAARRATLDSAAAQLREDESALQVRLDDLRANQLGLRTVLDQRLSAVQTRLSQVQTQQRLTTSGMTVIHNPAVPDEPLTPTPIRNTALAALLGLLLGISLAVLWESLRNRSRGDAVAGAAGSTAPMMNLPVAPDGYVRAGSGHGGPGVTSASPNGAEPRRR
jgi:uncharacterized protein involved in exopolysaccharide biosynthesis